MNNNTMTENTEVKKVTHDGREWATIGPKATHQQALDLKKECLDSVSNSSDFDFKVKLLSDGFYLKFREKQSSLDRKAKIEENQKRLLAEQKKEKREKKSKKDRT